MSTAAPAPFKLKTTVTALGIGQIISWGSLYYTVAVLGESMRHDLGVSEAVLFGLFSLCLLLSGLTAPFFGKLIDDRGGRNILSAGSLLAGVSLVMLATATGPITLGLAWSVAGVAMAACLYDPAFTTLNQIAGTSYRKSVTALTMFGGFASTTFWPLTQVLHDAVGWRQTLAIYAALQFFVCLPLHYWFLPRHAVPVRTDKSAEVPVQEGAAANNVDFALLAFSFALSAFVFSVMSVHLISMFKTAGLTAKEAVLVASLIGPMQVIGRILEFTFARHIRPIKVGTLSMAMMIIALLALYFLKQMSPLAIVFAAFYGFGAGMMTIVRGTVPAELYGRAGYGALLGKLARPSFIAKAFAPFVFSVAATAGLVAGNAILALFACVSLALVTYQIAVKRTVAASGAVLIR